MQLRNSQRMTVHSTVSVCEQMLVDIEKNTVDFMPNYDDRLQEPTVLPTKIPTLLINGSSGIAVGMAPHNPHGVHAPEVSVYSHHMGYRSAMSPDLLPLRRPVQRYLPVQPPESDPLRNIMCCPAFFFIY